MNNEEQKQDSMAKIVRLEKEIQEEKEKLRLLTKPVKTFVLIFQKNVEARSEKEALEAISFLEGGNQVVKLSLRDHYDTKISERVDGEFRQRKVREEEY